MQDPRWLDWAKRIQAIAQTGLAYVRDVYDRERYEQIRDIAVEIVAGHTGTDNAAVRDLFASDTGYATPKVDVRGGVFRDGMVLLVKEKMDGLWTLPGGWADIGLTPAEAVEKEVREESGFVTRAVKLAAVYDRNRQGHPASLFHIYKLMFVCDIVGGSIDPDHEIEEAAFFPENSLPELSVSRTTARQIGRLFEHARHPEMPTDFD